LKIGFVFSVVETSLFVLDGQGPGRGWRAKLASFGFVLFDVTKCPFKLKSFFYRMLCAFDFFKNWVRFFSGVKQGGFWEMGGESCVCEDSGLERHLCSP